MIDMHNHILMACDDGPNSLEDTITLLKQARDQGITDIIATPHHLHRKYNNTYKSVSQTTLKLNQNLTIKQLGVRIYPGQEIRISDRIFQEIEFEEIKGLNTSRYILIELPISYVPSATSRIFYELLNKGFTPIIAHPERNKEIANDLSVLYDLINQGALSQITASSLLGNFGKHVCKISIQMMNCNLTHFIASDAHDAAIRPFQLGHLEKDVKLKDHQETINMLIDNANHIITNEPIFKSQPFLPKKKKWFKLF
ncbi:tyrosine-protein phosphatase [Staphylococcus massiliensis]|uniref:Tyrosine-protein phosphatase n=1 Tax=Staphylococcus massiliensis S46 TaxID=1229783 RepID=K9B8C9_9STAP|nr:CpsB/CapC family capsule biosynthesis tyrosine phosphatase [Staphylococcus massiliensis]EKU49995.1 capsular polysaccharide biosynthesis protein [Staphylococcus massiliensis S46]POA00555.1 capsular biosynthesis protein [Staphylococcus massiliensis CCUG 55927]